MHFMTKAEWIVGLASCRVCASELDASLRYVPRDVALSRRRANASGDRLSSLAAPPPHHPNSLAGAIAGAITGFHEVELVETAAVEGKEKKIGNTTFLCLSFLSS
jgi:hypothetical protein